MALVRGPFIQSTSRRDTNIIWYTDTVEDSVVKVGTAVNNYTMTFKNTTPINTVASVPRQTDNVYGNYYKHTVRVTGLLPNTQYFYTIGNSTTTLQGNNQNFFWTSVNRNDNTTTKRIWAVADIGIGDATGMESARNAFRNFNSNTKIDSWLMIGDIAYDNGLFEEYNNFIFAANSGGGRYETELKKYVTFPLLGNHDYGPSFGSTSNVLPMDAPYFTIFKLPTLTECGGVASFIPRYYSYDVGNIHFITIDGYLTSQTTINSTQYRWLVNDLKNIKGEINQGNKKWIIVYCHFPPFNDGSHAGESYGERFRTDIVPLLHQYNVDLVLYGHDHNYQRSQFMHDFNGLKASWNASTYSYYPNSNGSGVGAGNSIYNKITYSGTVHIIQGNAGADTYGSGNYNGLNISTIGSTYGSGVIDITPGGGTGGSDRLTYRMITVGGSYQIGDIFHIDK
jgi:predicted phosphohydrolase